MAPLDGADAYGHATGGPLTARMDRGIDATNVTFSKQRDRYAPARPQEYHFSTVTRALAYSLGAPPPDASDAYGHARGGSMTRIAG